MRSSINIARSLLILSTLLSLSNYSAAQQELKATLEYRPRAELRNGYRQLPTDSSNAAYFITHRSRINLTLTQKKFVFHTSIQDLRVWGQYGQVSSAGSLNVFEAYAEQFLDSNWSVRMGRQKLELDNGRLFSASNWSQAGRAHDGINLIYNNKKLHTELIGALSQTSERIFETDYSPSAFSSYKTLGVHYLVAQLPHSFTLMLLNSADGSQSAKSYRTLYVRGNSGGRLSFAGKKLSATVAGYYQYGRIRSGQEVSAYYLQPEISFKLLPALTASAGAEYMSGDDAAHVSPVSHSFVPLYGVTWKFMGNMDYFTSFPSDMKNGGLINPYLFIYYDVSPKLSLRADQHLFYLQNKVFDNNEKVIPAYLGFENDLSARYKLNSYTSIDAGFSYLIATKSMELLKGGDSDQFPVWSYLMITFKPELFTIKQNEQK